MFLKLGKRKEILNIVKMGGQLSDRDYYMETKKLKIND